MYSIYKITFINGSKYVGITKNLRKRKIRHEWEARTKRSDLPVHRAMRKYAYEFELLCHCQTKQEASEIERLLIKELDNLYNLDSGGYGIHKERKYTDEQVLQDALKYDTKQDWRDNSKIANTVRKYNKELYKQATSHMNRKINRIWTKNSVMKEVRKYSTYKDWRTLGKKSYDIACKNGYRQEIKTTIFNKGN